MIASTATKDDDEANHGDPPEASQDKSQASMASEDDKQAPDQLLTHAEFAVMIASFATQDDDEAKAGDLPEGSANPSRVLGLILEVEVYVHVHQFGARVLTACMYVSGSATECVNVLH